MTDRQPHKQTVALAIFHADDSDKVLQVQRPEHDDDFPGVWGLPAASCSLEETVEETGLRVGLQKLGRPVRLGCRLAQGIQKRKEYLLQMVLVEAWLEGLPRLPWVESDPSVTLYSDWRWDVPSTLEEAVGLGSLCSRLLLKTASSRQRGV